MGRTLPGGQPETMVYDAAGNLTKHTDFNGHTTIMSYDPLNRMVSKTPDESQPYVAPPPSTDTNGNVTTYLTDDGNPTGYSQVIEERVNGAPVVKYLWGRSGLMAMSFLQGGTWTPRFYHFDGSHNVSFLTDGSGNVTDTYEYDAFGNVLTSTGSTPNHYLFAGEFQDPDVGLGYNRARWLDGQTGRFLSRDAWKGNMRRPATLNGYSYGGQHPLDSIDPTGHVDFSLTDMTASIGIIAIMGALILPAIVDYLHTGAQDPNADILRMNPLPMADPQSFLAHPDDASVYDNMLATRAGVSASGVTWWMNKVRYGGAWDYVYTTRPKTVKYNKFTQFNYGATGRAAGYGTIMLLAIAGDIQQMSNGFGMWNVSRTG